MLDAITRANDRWDWQWLSFALMSSHVHYGHVAGGRDPDRFFASVHTRFAMRIHARNEGATIGPVFADRPRIHPVREHALGRLVAYQHRNPREAGLVQRPSESRWTSHRAYLRLDPAPRWLDVEWALDVLGFEDTAAGRKRFDDFVMDVDLGERGWTLEPPPSREIAVRSGPAELDWGRLIRLARDATGMNPDESIASRRRIAARARWLVALIATRDFGYSYESVGARLGMRGGSVFNLLARMGRSMELEDAALEVRRRIRAKRRE